MTPPLRTSADIDKGFWDLVKCEREIIDSTCLFCVLLRRACFPSLVYFTPFLWLDEEVSSEYQQGQGYVRSFQCG